MDESWLNAFKKDPPADWAKSLHTRLQDIEMSGISEDRPHRRWIAIAAGILLIAGLFSFSAVRASAVSFLSLFRVVNFVAVPVDPERFRALDDNHLDLERLIGDHIQVLADPGPPQSVATTEEAAAIAGLDLRMPTWLPEDTKVIEVAVTGERAARVTADSKRLEELMDALGITDLRAPAGLDGQTMTVRVHPIIMVRYETGGSRGRRTRFLQARTPDVVLPAGVPASALGEIGLRVLGFPSDNARKFAAYIDWNTTLVVPVPPTVSSFRQIEIGGRPGVVMQYQPPNESPTTMVLWSRGDRVFALQSIQDPAQVLAMADSVR